MQQTSKYQFKLIEGTDDFSPTPLNENMEKVEEALNQEAEQREGVAETLAAVVASLGSGGQNARIAWGSYVGTGTFGVAAPNSLSFDFYPIIVFVGAYERANFGSWPGVFLRPCSTSRPDIGNNTMAVTWTDNGLSWYNTTHQDSQNNSAGYTYYYIAIGYSRN